MKREFINEVVADCRAYAKQHGCSFEDAVVDWEGDGPSGSWGLTTDERRTIIEAQGSRVCEMCGSEKPADQSCGCFDNGSK